MSEMKRSRQGAWMEQENDKHISFQIRLYKAFLTYVRCIVTNCCSHAAVEKHEHHRASSSLLIHRVCNLNYCRLLAAPEGLCWKHFVLLVEKTLCLSQEHIEFMQCLLAITQ